MGGCVFAYASWLVCLSVRMLEKFCMKLNEIPGIERFWTWLGFGWYTACYSGKHSFVRCIYCSGNIYHNDT